jgi:hypothetical protein
MSEDHSLWTSIDAGHAGYALFGIDKINPFLALGNAVHGADLSAFPTLSADTHLESPWIGKMGDYGQARLFGVVLPEVVERTSQKASPAPRALATIGSKVHSPLLVRQGSL